MVRRFGRNMLRIAGHTAAVKALAWAPPQGDYLASAGEDRVIRLWDLNERKEFSQLIPGHGGPVEDLAWSRDGAYLASCGHDFLVYLWDGLEGKHLGTFTERIKNHFCTKKVLNSRWVCTR